MSRVAPLPSERRFKKPRCRLRGDPHSAGHGLLPLPGRAGQERRERGARAWAAAQRPIMYCMIYDAVCIAEYYMYMIYIYMYVYIYIYIFMHIGTDVGFLQQQSPY